MLGDRDCRPDNGERGTAAVLVGLTFVVLLGFAALVLDVGALYRVRTELQSASDSAALAGVQELDRTAAGIDLARDRVKEYAALHQANGTPVVVADSDIIFGYWTTSSDAFTPLGSFPADPAAVNAVQVRSRRDAAQGDAVMMSLAHFVGHTREDVSATAIAVGGGPASECAFPIVVPDCSLDEPISSGLCDYCMVYQDNNSDNAGWTTFDEGSVGAPTIRDLIVSACYDGSGGVAVDPVTGECAGGCVSTDSGDEIKVNNGNLMNKGTNNFCPVIQDILLRGDPTGTPQPFVVKVPVLESTSGTCDASQFSGYKTISGYATMEIFGAKCGSVDPGVFAPASPCPPPPSSDKYLVAALRCDLSSEEIGGGGFFGIDALRVRLVR
jgi:Flp pilus assembly protein TadG